MNYEDKVIKFGLKKEKSYLYSQDKYDFFYSQLHKEDEDRKLIERYKSELQYI